MVPLAEGAVATVSVPMEFCWAVQFPDVPKIVLQNPSNVPRAAPATQENLATVPLKFCHEQLPEGAIGPIQSTVCP